MQEHEALVRQARSDFTLFELLRVMDRGVSPECHPLHYLQMATEKLAKAVYLALGVQVGDRFSHVAFSHLPHTIRRRDIAGPLGWDDFRAYQRFLGRTAGLFREIDELHPAVGPQGSGGGQEGSNVEYPWRARNALGTMDWHVPAEHRFGLLDRLLRSGDGASLLHLLRLLLERFDAIFAGKRDATG